MSPATAAIVSEKSTLTDLTPVTSDHGGSEDREDRPWNRRRVDGSDVEGDPEARDPFANDETVARIGRRFLWVRALAKLSLGAVTLLVALGIVAGLLALAASGTLEVSSLMIYLGAFLPSFGLYAGARRIPLVSMEGREVLETARSPDEVRARFADFRAPTFPLDRARANETEYFPNGWRIAVGWWRELRVEYATDPQADGTIDYEIRVRDEPSVRGTVTVEPIPSGSRVTMEYERLDRASLMQLVIMLIGGRFADRLFEHLGYEVVEGESSYRFRQ